LFPQSKLIFTTENGCTGNNFTSFTSLISPSILILTEPASSKTRRAASRFDFSCSGVKNAVSVDVNDTGSSVGRTASIAERERSFFFQSTAFSAVRFLLGGARRGHR